MMSKTISDSIQFLGNGKITALTFNITSRQWIQSVRYEVNAHDNLPYIVTVSGRQKLFKLSDNPDVLEFRNDIYYIHSLQKDPETAEDIDVDIVYQVDKSSGNVFKVPHLYIQFENGNHQVFYNETAETYYNILTTIQKQFPDIVSGLFVKVNGTYEHFLDLEL